MVLVCDDSSVHNSDRSNCSVFLFSCTHHAPHRIAYRSCTCIIIGLPIENTDHQEQDLAAQEVLPEEVVAEEDLPECPNHIACDFEQGKPWSIFLLVCQSN